MNFKAENKLIKQGFKVAGLDEAGRGAWAGPLVAGCVFIDRRLPLKKGVWAEINDSKILSKQKRLKLFDWLTQRFIWSVGVVSARKLDKIGLAQANKLALQRATYKLSKKPTIALVDYFNDIGLPISTQGIKKGDSEAFCIAAASIIAKVYRDELMIELSKRYIKWDFDKHKGYGTKLHRENLKKYGISPIHRKSFKPIQKIK